MQVIIEDILVIDFYRIVQCKYVIPFQPCIQLFEEGFHMFLCTILNDQQEFITAISSDKSIIATNFFQDIAEINQDLVSRIPAKGYICGR